MPAPSMVIGGIAVIAQGFERLTTDIDATVLVEDLGLDRLISRFLRAGFVARMADVEEFARQTRVVLLRHESSGVELDLSLAGLSFEERALARAEVRSVGGIKLRVAHPTDLIIYKMVAHRSRDLDDAEAMVRLHRGRVHASEIDEAIAMFSSVLEDDGPLEAWHEVKRRVALR